MKRILFNLILIIITLLLASCSTNNGIFSLVEENDYFNFTDNTDSQYSQGLELRYDTEDNKRYAIGQTIHTPKNKKSSELIKDDRPYAGHLYTHYEIAEPESATKVLRYGVQFGIIGPYSYAEETQKFIHRILDNNDPAGWDNQLNTEATINLNAEYHGVMNTPGKYWDILYAYGLQVGNVQTSLDSNLTLRIGSNLSNTMVVDPINTRNKNDFNYNFFISTDDKVVLHNIFLDGNTFEDSHSVNRIPFVSEFGLGFYLEYQDFFFSYTYKWITKEYSEQNDIHKFGIINIGKRV